MKITKLSLLICVLFSFLIPEGENAGFSYLNELRKKANIIPFTRNTLLDTASYNHSNYLQINDAGGHTEDTTKSGSTGASPGDRVKYVGLYSKVVGENVSTGQFNFNDSIDDLFTAIYHRLGFLDVTFDMVGLSKVEKKYTYKMSNSLLEDLCENSPSERRGQLICANDKAFEPATVNGLKKQIADTNPKVIIWPPNNSDDNPPYFYDESPDPLPNHDVSGNPISITFNKFFHTSPPTMNNFKLFDNDGKEVQTMFRSKANAINVGYLDEYSFILFPEERLNWGSTYKIEYDFSSASGDVKGSSTFKTRELSGKVYYVKEKDAKLSVISGQEYIIDLIPLNKNDNTIAKGYGGGGSAQAEGFTIISQNTFKVSIKGGLGKFVKYTLGGGARSVTLTISDSDNVGNDAKDDDSGAKKEISYTKGWNLKGLLDKTTINNTEDYFKDFNVLYTYNGSSFIFNPNKIEYTNAYFVHYSKNTTNKVPFKENETYEISANTLKKNVWNLVPIGKDINNPYEYFNVSELIYILINSKYEKPKASNGLKRGDALWVKIE